MGLIANYSCLSDANLKEIKAMGSEEEEILESVEEWTIGLLSVYGTR